MTETLIPTMRLRTVTRILPGFPPSPPVLEQLHHTPGGEERWVEVPHVIDQVGATIRNGGEKDGSFFGGLIGGL